MIAATHPDSVTRVTSIVALGLAVASLVWQAATFLLSGARVRARIVEGLRNPATGGVMVATLSTYSDGGAAVRASGFHEHVVGIEARNAGRMSTTITGWSISFGGGVAVYTNATDPRNMALPYRLEPESPMMWWAEADHIIQWAEAVWKGGHTGRVVGRIEAGGRRTVRTSNSLRVVRGRIVVRERLVPRFRYAVVPRRRLARGLARVRRNRRS